MLVQLVLLENYAHTVQVLASSPRSSGSVTRARIVSSPEGGNTMHQAFIVGPMLASGLALFGSAARIQADRSAWIRAPQDEPAPVRMSVSSLKDEPLVIRRAA